MMMQYYDIIGDIHGHADALEALLLKLGYRQHNGVYRHPAQKVLFLGDLIDRGPKQRRVIDIVQAMVEQGQAVCIMGNHEFNAICYASLGAAGQPLRANNARNQRQHAAFLDAYPDTEERQQVITWFKSLPVFFETNDIRIIHAAWNEPALSDLSGFLDADNCLLASSYEDYADKSSSFYRAIEILLKGPEAHLPAGVSFKDKEGTLRYKARIMWWNNEDLPTIERLHLGHSLSNGHKLDELSLDQGHHYPASHKPLFVGHYWLDEEVPSLCADNCACLDYSIARQGKLVAYQWRGECILSADNFTWAS
ncbi:MAG: metallophosphoesterase [Cycloclasticus sp.]